MGDSAMKRRFRSGGDRRRSFWESRQALRGERLCPRLRRLAVELLEDRRLLDGAMDGEVIELFDASPALFVKNKVLPPTLAAVSSCPAMP